MSQDEEKSFWRILLFALISLLLHLGLVIFFLKIPNSGGSGLAPEPPPQEVVWVQPQAEPPPPAAPAAHAQPMELADIAKPKVEKLPLHPRFASQYNSSVKDQTVAPKVPKKAKMNAETSEEDGQKGDQAKEPGPKPKEVAMAPKPEEAPEEKSPKKIEEPQEKPKEEPKELPKEEKSVSLKDLDLKPADFKDMVPKDKTDKKSEKDTDSLQGKKFSALPSQHFGKPGLPGEGDNFAHDFLPGIKIGDKTYLDAEAFPDVGYFLRLKRAFRLRFNPAPPLRSYFAGNHVVVGKVVVTMAVTVSPSGQLKDLFVVKSSGIPGYDQEALETVRESSPFSAPPTKVCDKDGILRMTWNFVTYL